MKLKLPVGGGKSLY